MGDYVKITDFAVKDSLLTGNPLKLITGTAHDNEYNAIAVAIATKVDESGGTLTNGTLVNPALGTPASGTLTNCTGLPLAGVTDSTTEALGVGSLELGHATDTTLTRVSAGVMAVEGVNVLTTSTGAALAGSATQTFSVAAASSAAHSVRYDQLRGGGFLRTFKGTFTRDLTAASGTVSITGVGFKPNLVRFYGSIAAALDHCNGEASSAGNIVQVISTTTANNGVTATACIYFTPTAGNEQTATCAMTADGFDLTWTKTGAPTGTGSVVYMAEE